MANINNNNNPNPGALAVLPPDPTVAAEYTKLVLEECFKDANPNVRKALYAIIVANYDKIDMFTSRMAQVIGKIPKLDYADLNKRLADFPYDQVGEPQVSVDELLARRRLKGEKEITSLAAIVHEYGGTITSVGKVVDGKEVPWSVAKLTYNGVEYTGEGASKQLAAFALFNDNEPIRGLAAGRSYEEPSAEDPVEKQRANLYFQRIGKAVVVKVVVGADGKWGASGNIGEVTTQVSGLPGKVAARRTCTYALYNEYKTRFNVPDDEYKYIEGAPGSPNNAMQL